MLLYTKLTHTIDRLLGSKYNPFYQSGTVLIFLLAILAGSGGLLIFFYKTQSPYASIAWISDRLWLGQTLRSIHRYSADLSVLFLLVHILKMLAQHRTWGPRVVAWISGCVMLLFWVIVGWSGAVLVWNEHGMWVLKSAMSALSIFPVFTEAISLMFIRPESWGHSFFFIVLFLHSAVPLGILLGVWIHTMALPRVQWLPSKPVIGLVSLCILTVSIAMPISLGLAANPYRIATVIKWDIFYDGLFYLSTIFPSHIGWVWLSGIVAMVGLSTVPWWWPKGKHVLPSVSDSALCTGCKQCEKDCPFDAIEMRPRPNKKGQFSFVIADKCVSCGICVASCSDFAIGPPLRTGQDQKHRIHALLNTSSTHSQTLILYCQSLANAEKTIRRIYSNSQTHPRLDFPCMGELHMVHFQALQKKYKEIILWACPEHECWSREGVKILQERLSGKRHPKPRHIKPYKWISGNPLEFIKTLQNISRKNTLFSVLKIALFMGIIGIFMVLGSSLPLIMKPLKQSQLVVGLILRGHAFTRASDINQQQLALTGKNRPSNNYKLKLTIDHQKEEVFLINGTQRDYRSYLLARTLDPGHHIFDIELWEISHAENKIGEMRHDFDATTSDRHVIWWDSSTHTFIFR